MSFFNALNEASVRVDERIIKSVFISTRFWIVESKIAKAEVLDLSVLINPVLRTLTPNPRLLDSAKGSLGA